MTTVDFNSIIAGTQVETDIADRFSTNFPLPNAGDIFELQIDDEKHQYQYIGDFKAITICQIEPEFSSYLAQGSVEIIDWDSLLGAADDALDAGFYVWGEIVMGQGVTSPDLREKIDILQDQLIEVELVDPVAAVQIANTLEFLEN